MKYGDKWGPTCWIFFHCLAERVKEDSFKEMYPIILKFIRDICAILPCPDCRLHATYTLNSYKFFHLIKTKNDFRNFLFEFHNLVNSRTGKPMPSKLILDQYKKYNFRQATADWYNHFTVNTYDVKLLWEKKERNKVRANILNELNENIKHFDI